MCANILHRRGLRQSALLLLVDLDVPDLLLHVRLLQLLELRNDPPEFHVVRGVHDRDLHEGLRLERGVVQEVLGNMEDAVHAPVPEGAHHLLAPATRVCLRDDRDGPPRDEIDHVRGLSRVHDDLPRHVDLVPQVLRKDLLVVV